ncbi:ammonium transporter [Actinomarinicola tropica]|uniref:Ammonium transporter n=1 Tax=Actinomarinicola tropica TaxID=2789776 RepID=A0A5Q2RQT5_9ACTN|nr:ammonium transporter [Actinomarinicola tropica]QGG96786.1 ammonium transporter [Actinomarinicola tropica]
MRKKVLTGAGVVGAATLLTATPALAQDELTADSVQVALDNVWILVAAVLVIFMQAGFALVEAGLTRAKNVSNIMMKNLMDFCAGVLAFGAVGFAFAYGPGNDFIGTEGFFLNPNTFTEGYFGTLTLSTSFIFQVAFAATAATIVSGAMAERTKFKSYFIYSFVLTAVIYPIVVHWTWGGGWLAQRATPFTDFAGSTIVHSVGGWAALMGAIILGPRIGKYGEDGKPRAIPGHSIPFAIVGVFILTVGWFGFNPGSVLAADPAVGAVAVTTVLSAAAGGVVAMITIWLVSGKPDVAMAGNGVLAGLVGITAGTGDLSNWGAIITGVVAGALVVGSVLFFDRVRVDDPVGAISVHGVCGAWGTLAVGLLATDGGLLYGDGADLLVTQLIGVVAVFVFVTVTAGALFMAIKATVGLRVEAEEEIAGLDVLEHGAPGYGPDILAGSSAVGH